MLFTDKKGKITMLEFGSRQNITDMDTKLARGNNNNNNNNDNNNNNNHDNVYGAVIVLRALREFTRFTR